MKKAVAYLFIVIGFCLSSFLGHASISLDKFECLFNTESSPFQSVSPLLEMPSESDIVEKNGHKFFVVFLAGSSEDSQQGILLSLNGYTSKVLDPKGDSLYSLSGPNGGMLQCHVSE